MIALLAALVLAGCPARPDNRKLCETVYQLGDGSSPPRGDHAVFMSECMGADYELVRCLSLGPESITDSDCTRLTAIDNPRFHENFTAERHLCQLRDGHPQPPEP
jgi:hypothetical protein